ncbi:acyl-CoA synthetase [uncultured Gimesia sp.]|uniref:acyl-CoA synthetase n=1 Tax=uncultured Gimesia sp. TaxID=1678688 RepID=UPI002604455E|nr:acyl-CoA synthetase [uncultured Gimesia sp.]
MKQLPIIDRAISHGDSIAVQSDDQRLTYHDLLTRSANAAASFLDSQDDLNEKCVAFLAPNLIDYLTVQWGIWRAGGIAVPLSHFATEKELEYTLGNSEAAFVVTTREYEDQMIALCDLIKLRIIVLEDIQNASENHLPEIDPARRAMILYTSGTTSQPKGVVTSHNTIQAQIESLVEAWKWQSDDRIPLFLPLYHIHAVINIVACALWTGAEIESFPRFNLDSIFTRVAARAFTVFMAVPTIYIKMIQALESMPESERLKVLDGFAKMRLMVSGSAALPAQVYEHWKRLTGQSLLERYGMTEIGMALSNPFEGERRPGYVGQPLPGVEVRLLSEKGEEITAENESGEIQVRGPNVFLEYWNRPEATQASFRDGWFCTGDVAVLEEGYYRIMGRSSVDIIKSGGYKLSALEIESTILDHPDISECVIVGLPDETWGEVVAIATVMQPGKQLSLEELQAWCQDCLSSYKIPRRLMNLEQLPRNAMGKVTKPAVQKQFQE